MARDLQDFHDIEASEMFATARSMIQGCANQLRDCRKITYEMALTMSASDPELADRCELIGMRVEDKLHQSEGLLVG